MDLDQLLRTLAPQLHEGVYAFAVLPSADHPVAARAVATFREEEGLSVILPEADALAAGLPVLLRAAWITLEVHSPLDAAGLTAAVAGALADEGIACNVVAAAHHDHLFVPVQDAGRALARLRALQAAR